VTQSPPNRIGSYDEGYAKKKDTIPAVHHLLFFDHVNGQTPLRGLLL